MVSDILKRILPVLAALLASAACDRPYSLDLPLAVDSHEYSLGAKAGEARIFFYTTRAWTISLEPGDCSWASLNRTSGNGKADVEEIIVSYGQNDGSDRSVTLNIKAGKLHEQISIYQTGSVRDWWDGPAAVDDLEVRPQENVQ